MQDRAGLNTQAPQDSVPLTSCRALHPDGKDVVFNGANFAPCDP